VQCAFLSRKKINVTSRNCYLVQKLKRNYAPPKTNLQWILTTAPRQVVDLLRCIEHITVNGHVSVWRWSRNTWCKSSRRCRNKRGRISVVMHIVRRCHVARNAGFILGAIFFIMTSSASSCDFIYDTIRTELRTSFLFYGAIQQKTECSALIQKTISSPAWSPQKTPSQHTR